LFTSHESDLRFPIIVVEMSVVVFDKNVSKNDSIAHLRRKIHALKAYHALSHSFASDLQDVLLFWQVVLDSAYHENDIF